MLKRPPNTTSDSEPSFLLQDSDEGEDDEDMALQSGSEGTSSEPREDHTDASSVEVTSSRPRRAATLRRAFSVSNPAAAQEAPEARRRSTRSLSAHNQSNKYQPPKGHDMQVQTDRQHTDGGSALTVVSNNKANDGWASAAVESNKLPASKLKPASNVHTVSLDCL